MKNMLLGVSCWLSGLRVQCCGYCSSGYSCGSSLIFSPGTSTYHRRGPPPTSVVFLLSVFLPFLLSPPSFDGNDREGWGQGCSLLSLALDLHKAGPVLACGQHAVNLSRVQTPVPASWVITCEHQEASSPLTWPQACQPS